MRKFINYSLVTIILVAIGYFAYFKLNASKKGDLAPNFKTQLVDGSSFELKNLEGEYVLLNFWGSWCEPCRKENPTIVRLSGKYGSKLTIVTVALEKNEDSWRKIAEKQGFSWKNQIVEKTQFVMMSPIAKLYGVSSIPSKFLIDPEGRIMEADGFYEIEKILDLKFTE